ncbi:hypothetical protein AB0M87_19315 [Streptomyces sp. NPDC051320]|uniref:hypothetical protein n=1 Tax=Streptomyces sp. NPDC051320 TaxID=3154644 RepID=UPI003447E067
MNVALSRCTVLSRLMRMPLRSTPRVLGMDDFTLYGDTYGTLWSMPPPASRSPQGGPGRRTAQPMEAACRDGSLTY